MEFKQYLAKGVNLFRYSSTNEDFIRRKGRIFCFLSVSGSNKEKFGNINKTIWDTVIDEYSQAKSTRVVESIKNALKEGARISRDLLKKDKDYKDTGIDLSFTIVVEAERRIYIGRFGNHEILAWHNNRYINISQHLEKNRVKVASTVLGAKDVLLVATEEYGKKLLKSDFSMDTLDRVAEKETEGQGLAVLSRTKLEKSEKPRTEDKLVEESKAEKKKESDAEDEPEIEDLSNAEKLDDTPGGIKKVDTVDIMQNSEEDEEAIPIVEDLGVASNVKSAFVSDRESDEEHGESTVDQDSEASGDSEGLGDADDADKHSVATHLPDKQKSVSPDSNNKKPESSDNSNETNASKESIFARILGGFRKKDSSKDVGKDNENQKSAASQKKLGHDSQISIDEIAQRQKEISESEKSSAHGANSNKTDKPAKNGKSSVDQRSPKVPQNRLKQAVTMFDKVISFIGLVFQKLGAVIMAIVHFLMGVAGQKYGRQPWYKKWSAKLSQAKIRMGASPGNIKVVGYQEAERRKKLIGTIVLGLILVVLFIYGYRFAQRKKQERELHIDVVSKVEQAQGLVDEADRLARSDPATAQSKLDEADQLVSEAQAKAEREDDKNLITEVESQMLKVDDEINLRSSLRESDENIAVYMDGKLRFGDQSNPTDISIAQLNVTNEYLFVGDSGESAVYRISLSNDTIIRIPDALELITEPKYVSAGLGGVFVYDTSEGVISSLFDNENKNQDFTRVDGSGLDADALEEKDVSSLIILTVYDNIYLLSQNDEAILKSNPRTAGNYALPWKFLEEPYLADGTDLFADDEYVYTTSKSEGIKRYKSQGGVLVEFPVSVEGLNKPLEDVTCGFSSSLNENVYVYDAASKRIIAFDRLAEDGKLIMDRQYVYRGDTQGAFSDVKDIVVDQDDEYLYLLDGVRIWRIEL
ncbi:hypothetical protein GF357_00625 [Candidatus Dojkabacteria bacterium]|nr:hypothetical protein [Candidatus Dojkabacteria bacterium]